MEEKDFHSPWYLVFDHVVPDGKRLEVCAAWVNGMNDHRLKPVVSIRSETLRYHRLNSALPPGSAFVPRLVLRAKSGTAVVSSRMKADMPRDEFVAFVRELARVFRTGEEFEITVLGM